MIQSKRFVTFVMGRDLWAKRKIRLWGGLLESDGLLIRTVFPEVPPRVEYSLSELGENMQPILNAMESFGKE